VARNGLANLLRQQKRFKAALVVRPQPETLQSVQDHRDMVVHCMILVSMEHTDTAIRLLRLGLNTAPTQQIPYYRRWLLLARLKANQIQEKIELSQDADVAEKIIYLHLYAKQRRLKAARKLAQELNRQERTMTQQTRKTFNLVETTFCGLDKTAHCQPTQEELTRLFEAETNMLAEVA